ncbi:MAG: cyclic nucleotide-binding domain-containing protein [Elusimicrobia bacterium]|nr:cyclic nucleotide-binding domain-containing protein [Elusimicrobiota bacterium]
MPQDDTLFLKSKVNILSFIEEAQLRQITPDIEHRTYAKGQVILLRGEVSNDFYIIKKGKVSVTLKGAKGAPSIWELSIGEFFGEISMLENTAVNASIKAVEDDTEVLTIPHSSFQKLLEMQPILKQALLEKIASRKAS